MGSYRKKPVVIEARHFAGACDMDERRAIAAWCGGALSLDGTFLKIPTLEGAMTANLYDWVIRGVKGEFYPCKPDIFAATYEPVDERGPDEA